MGLFEKLFPKKDEAQAQKSAPIFELLTAYQPAYRSWRGELYESELVRAAVDARARHISKLKPEFRGSAQPKLQTSVKHKPNGLQTWSQLLYRTSTILDMKNTCFLVKVYDRNMYPIGLTAILPSKYELVEFNGEPWLRFYFYNGKTAAERLADVGILTRYQYRSDFFGDSNSALDSTMELIDLQRQGISESVKNSTSYRFYARVNNFSTVEHLKKERERFTENNLMNSADSSGILLFPNTYADIHQVEQKAYDVNSEEEELIRKNVFNYFGVNEKILQNAAMSGELDAFFNGCIEPFEIQMSEVVTNMFFTALEMSNGASFTLSANRLQYMSVKEKVEMAKQLGDRGAIMIDEIRDLFNMPPLPDGNGQHAPIRGEYYYAGEDEKPDEDMEDENDARD